MNILLICLGVLSLLGLILFLVACDEERRATKQRRLNGTPTQR